MDGAAEKRSFSNALRASHTTTTTLNPLRLKESYLKEIPIKRRAATISLTVGTVLGLDATVTPLWPPTAAGAMNVGIAQIIRG